MRRCAARREWPPFRVAVPMPRASHRASRESGPPPSSSSNCGLNLPRPTACSESIPDPAWPILGRMRACLAVLVVALSLVGGGQTACASKLETDTLPARLSDDEFWTLSEQLSEPPGAFTH